MKSALVLVILLNASPCLAGSHTPWIGGAGSFNTYAMGRINDEIEGINEHLAPYFSMPTIESAYALGVSAGANLDRWSFSVHYENLPASTSLFEVYDLPGHEVLARAARSLLWTEDFDLRVGGGAGVAWTSGSIGSDSPRSLRLRRPRRTP